MIASVFDVTNSPLKRKAPTICALPFKQIIDFILFAAQDIDLDFGRTDVRDTPTIACVELCDRGFWAGILFFELTEKQSVERNRSKQRNVLTRWDSSWRIVWYGDRQKMNNVPSATQPTNSLRSPFVTHFVGTISAWMLSVSSSASASDFSKNAT